MEKFTVNPQSVRGLGNILFEKDVLDMLEYFTEVDETTDTVNETTMPVFTMDFLEDGEGDTVLPYDVNAFLQGALYGVTFADGKLGVTYYESSDLEITTLRQLKHCLRGKVSDVTFTDNVLTITTFDRTDLLGLSTKEGVVSLLANVVYDVRVEGNSLVIEKWTAEDVQNGIPLIETV